LKYINAQRDGVQNEVSRHVRGEQDVYDKGLYEGAIAGAIEDAARYNNDPEAVANAKRRIQSSIMKMGERFGLSAEVQKQMQEKNVSTMHAGIVERMIVNGQGTAAKDYLAKAIKDKKIDGADVAALEKGTRQASVAQESAEMVKTEYNIDDKVSDIVKRLQSFGKSQEAIDEAVTRVKQQRQIDDSDIRREQKSRVESAWKHIEDGGSFDTIQNKSDIDGMMLSRMQDYATLKRMGKEPMTGWGVYSDLSNRLAAGETDINLMDYRDKLSDGEFKSLSNDKQSAIKSAANVEAIGAPGTFTQKINDAIAANGIKIKADQGKFKQIIRSEMQRAAREKGSDLNYDERQSVIDRNQINMNFDGSWTGDQPLWKVKANGRLGDVSVNSIDDVPKTWQSTFNNFGKEWNEENAMHAYSLFLRGDKAGLKSFLEGT